MRWQPYASVVAQFELEEQWCDWTANKKCPDRWKSRKVVLESCYKMGCLGVLSVLSTKLQNCLRYNNTQLVVRDMFCTLGVTLTANSGKQNWNIRSVSKKAKLSHEAGILSKFSVLVMRLGVVFEFVWWIWLIMIYFWNSRWGMGF